MSLDIISTELKFLECSEQLQYICQVKQTTHPNNIESMKLPYFVHPLDNITEANSESFVGFSNKSILKTELASAANFMGSSNSFLTDMSLPDKLSTLQGLTLGVWIYPRKLDGEQYIMSIGDFIHFMLVDGRPRIDLFNEDGNSFRQTNAHALLVPMKWQFVAAVIYNNGISAIFIDEHYGYKTNGEGVFTSEREFFPITFEESSPQIIFGNNQERDKGLLAKISCLQYYDKPLSKAQIYQMSKVCHVDKEYRRVKACPDDSILMDKTCYKMSAKPMTYTEAQLECTSPLNSNRVSRVAFPKSYQHHQNLLVLAHYSKSVDSIFIGADSLSGS